MDTRYLIVLALAAIAGSLTNLLAKKIGGYEAERVGAVNAAKRARARMRERADAEQLGIGELSDSAIGRAIQNMLPASAEQEAEQRDALMRSGLKIPVASFQAARMICMILFLLVGTLLGARFLSGFQIVAAIALGAVVGAILPQLYLISIRAKWRDEIERQLPSALDLMCVSVAAGSTFEAAVRTCAENIPGAMGEALGDVMAQAQFMDVTDALKRFADTAGVKPLSIFAASLLSSRASGAKMVDVLKNQADTVRNYRRMKIEEEINKLPVKMIFPIVFFIFPALFGIVLVPAAAQLMSSLAGL